MLYTSFTVWVRSSLKKSPYFVQIIIIKMADLSRVPPIGSSRFDPMFSDVDKTMAGVKPKSKLQTRRSDSDLMALRSKLIILSIYHH